MNDMFNDLVTIDRDKFFPLVKFDFNGQLAGPGHQDVLAFAMSASAFLDFNDGADIFVNPTDVHHCWMCITEDGFYEIIMEREDRSVPVTVVKV